MVPRIKTTLPILKQISLKEWKEIEKSVQREDKRSLWQKFRDWID